MSVRTVTGVALVHDYVRGQRVLKAHVLYSEPGYMTEHPWVELRNLPRMPYLRYIEAIGPRDANVLKQMIRLERERSFVASPKRPYEQPEHVIPHLGAEHHIALAYDPRLSRWDRPATPDQQYILDTPTQHHAEYLRLQVLTRVLYKIAHALNRQPVPLGFFNNSRKSRT